MSVASDAWFKFMESAEGGLSLDPNDSGNYYHGLLIGSNLGLTGADMAVWLNREPTAADMADITSASAKPIAMALYWQAMMCPAMWGAVAFSVCDFGYNAGVGESARVLQSIVGTEPDGWIGPKTIAAIVALNRASLIMMAHNLSPSAAQPVQRRLGLTPDGLVGPLTQAALAKCLDGPALILAARLADAQGDVYRSFAQFPRYGRGWLNRTADRLAAAIALTAPQPMIGKHP